MIAEITSLSALAAILEILGDSKEATDSEYYLEVGLNRRIKPGNRKKECF